MTRRSETRTISSPTATRKAPEMNSPALVPNPAGAAGSWFKPKNWLASLVTRWEMRLTRIIIKQTFRLQVTQDCRCLRKLTT